MAAGPCSWSSASGCASTGSTPVNTASSSPPSTAAAPEPTGARSAGLEQTGGQVEAAQQIAARDQHWIGVEAPSVVVVVEATADQAHGDAGDNAVGKYHHGESPRLLFFMSGCGLEQASDPSLQEPWRGRSSRGVHGPRQTGQQGHRSPAPDTVSATPPWQPT